MTTCIVNGSILVHFGVKRVIHQQSFDSTFLDHWHQLVLALPVVTQPSVVSSRRPLVLLSCQLVVESPVIAPSSCRAALSSSSHCATLLSSRCPLTASPSCCLTAPTGCCVTSASRTAVSSFRRPLTVLPSCRLIAPDGCCVAFCRIAISFSCRAALSFSHCTPDGC